MTAKYSFFYFYYLHINCLKVVNRLIAQLDFRAIERTTLPLADTEDGVHVSERTIRLASMVFRLLKISTIVNSQFIVLIIFTYYMIQMCQKTHCWLQLSSRVASTASRELGGLKSFEILN